MKHKIKIFAILACIIQVIQVSASTLIFESPNKKVVIRLSDNKGEIRFGLKHNNKTIFDNSLIGLEYNKYDLTVNTSINLIDKKSNSETWKPVYGKTEFVRNNYNEYRIEVRKNASISLSYQIQFRIYDDGFGYRYIFDNKSDVNIDRELTMLNFKRNYTHWSYNHEQHPMGPINRKSQQVEKIYPPMVLKFNEESYLAIHEANIEWFEPFSINASNKDYDLSFDFNYSKFKGKQHTSWRAFILSDRVGGLVESNLLVNLNEPCKIEDTSWIKPGKTVWDWRVCGYESKIDGFKYGLNTVSHKRYVDFAAQNNIQFMLVDADWYGHEFSKDSDPTQPIGDVDIVGFIKYAKAKNVDVILYLNDVGANNFGLERVLKQFVEWGAVGVKYGFMRGSEEEKARKTRNVIELCAKYKLMVVFHDKMTPLNGEERTWPNMMSKEMVFATADTKYIMYPETPVNSLLVNMIAGPLDASYGIFDLNTAHNRDKVRTLQLGTVVGELAKIIATYSGWMILPDAPEAYVEKPELLACIRDIPASFDELKVLDAKLDEYVTIARRDNQDWFIASLSNRNARELEIDLSFLPDTIKYEAIIYSDDANSHFVNKKEAYKVLELKNVTNKSKIKATIAPGGGHVVQLKAIK